MSIVLKVLGCVSFLVSIAALMIIAIPSIRGGRSFLSPESVLYLRDPQLYADTERTNYVLATAVIFIWWFLSFAIYVAGQLLTMLMDISTRLRLQQYMASTRSRQPSQIELETEAMWRQSLDAQKPVENPNRSITARMKPVNPREVPNFPAED